jgi:membrane protease YdiL (CAAX protease family)
MVHPGQKRLSALTLFFAAALYIAWTAAWLVESALEHPLPWLRDPGAQTAYWTLAKLLLWIAPLLFLIRLSGRRLDEMFGFARPRAILLWGGGVGLLLVLLALVQKTTNGQAWHLPVLGWSLLSGVLISPVVEEIAFRGAILGNFLQRHSFVRANTLTSFLFLGVHLPGWYFQGKLAGAAFATVSLFFLGWVFGLVAFKSKSVAASILAHMLNNLANA